MASASLMSARYCYPRFVADSVTSEASSSNNASPSLLWWISSRYLQKFSSETNNWKHYILRGQSMEAATTDKPQLVDGPINSNSQTDHLLVLVHGILAGPSDWTYVQAQLRSHLGKNFLIYASSSNTYGKTLNGIDGAGNRLADEVMQIVDTTSSLRRISFLCHSLGGLFARYAIAVLFSQHKSPHSDSSHLANSKATNSSKQSRIAGLEPVNFITLATPHLGVRGKKQLPFLMGIPFLEKLAPPIAPLLAGQTGRQLFLTDGVPDKPPLLLRMASDSKDLPFLSALGAFKCRILYANVSYDHMVGWRTSSIRKETELEKPVRKFLDGYKHVINVEYSPPTPSEGPHFPQQAAKAKEAAQKEPSSSNTVQYHEIMEDEMIHGLQQLGWTKVDVSFHSSLWPFFAHNHIHVKNEWLHKAGAGVIAHVANTLKQQETSAFISSNL